MTQKTTLSFTDRHADYLRSKVADGVFATTSSAVAAAVERLIEDEAAQEAALSAIAEEIRARAATNPADFVEEGDIFDAALRTARDE